MGMHAMHGGWGRGGGWNHGGGWRQGRFAGGYGHHHHGHFRRGYAFFYPGWGGYDDWYDPYDYDDSYAYAYDDYACYWRHGRHYCRYVD